MSKSKSKGAKPMKAAVPLTKVNSGGVTKPAKVVQEQSKELAKKLGKKEKKTEKKKPVKEPTPEPSSEEEDSADESSSDSESEEESDVETKPVTNGKIKAAEPDSTTDEESDESESDSESDTETTPHVASKANGTAAVGKDDVSEESEDDSDDGSDSDSDDDDQAGVSAVMGAPLNDVNGKHAGDDDGESDDGSGSSSEESDSDVDEVEPAAKADVKMNGAANKVESEDEEGSDSDDSASDSEGSDSSEESEAEVKPKSTKRKAEDSAPAFTKKAKVEEVVDSEKKTLFVGNLSWNVNEDWLRSEFEGFGDLAGVRIVTDRESGRSKGYGYVDFENAKDAAEAHRERSGYELDGRNLNVDFANARPSNDQRQQNRRSNFGDAVGEASDTLFIGNLSFEADTESLTETFHPHGTVLGVRIPTDQETGRPKGFGYVTFSSVDEAKAALEAMQGGYMNGRPMRLDYSGPRPAQNGRGGGGGFGGGRGRGDSRGRGGFGGGRGRGGFDRGGRGGGRGGARGGRGGTTNRGGFNDYKGNKVSFD